MKGKTRISDLLENKKVLFITTKNSDYIRNTQEMTLIENSAKSVKIIAFTDKGYLKRLIKVYLQLAGERAKKYDVVFMGFSPQLIMPIWRWKFKKCQIIIDFFISMYDTLVCDRQTIKDNTVLARLLHRIDERTLKYADHVIADTKAHGEFFNTEFGADRDKLEVLYLEVDHSLYYPREQRKGAYADKFLVLYFGSILPLQGVETVLAAAERLKGNHEIYFIVIGPVKKGKGRYEGDNIEYTDWLSQKELAERIAMADLCLAGHFNAHIGKAKRTIPGKAYIYEAMNKPMILGDNLANRELFREDDRHFYVEMGNVQALADKIDGVREKLRIQKGTEGK